MQLFYTVRYKNKNTYGIEKKNIYYILVVFIFYFYKLLSKVLIKQKGYNN